MSRIKRRVSAYLKPSLGRRLAFYFTIFGLMIGYFSYIFNTMHNTMEFINFARTMVLQRLYVAAGSERGDMFLSLLNREEPEIQGFARQIRYFSIETHSLREISAYIYDTAGKRWSRVYLDNNNIFRSAPVSDSMSRELRKCINDHFHISHSMFVGKADHVSVRVDITRPVDSNRYLLNFDITREGFLDFIRNNVLLVAVFTILLLLISNVLSHFIVSRLLRPLHDLSEMSSMIASGEYSREITVSSSDEVGDVARSVNILTRKIQGNIIEIEQRMKAMETMNRIDKAVLSSVSRGDLLDRVIGILSSMVSCQYIAIVIRNAERGGFELLSYFDTDHQKILGEHPFISNEEVERYMKKSYMEYFQIRHRSGIGMKNFFGRLAGEHIGSIVNVPLYIYGEYLGSLIISRKEGSGFHPDEEEVIRMLADQVGVALNSVNLLDEKENMLLGILVALTRSIDAKSKWTAGHSERVARLVETLGGRLGFNEEQMRLLSISAILHDIGKIAIPEIILDKPGLLTPEERVIVEQHPERGVEIIGDIPAYRDLLPGILYHHEHWDGSGYPSGLHGPDIPLNARLIAVCDVYDAITDDRPYRKGMSGDDAVRFMISQKGKLFDPELVDVFLDSISSPL